MGGWCNHHAVHQKDCISADVPWNLRSIYLYISGSWGNFFIPYILLSSADKQPAAVLLYQFFGQHGSISYGPLAAFSVIYALPSIILYILSQNYMSKGFTMSGAAKG